MAPQPLLSPDRWRRLETLFAQALDRPPGERTAFLEAACDDDALRADLLRLLRAHDCTDGFLDGLDLDRAGALLESMHADPDAGGIGPTQDIGRLIGPYRVVREVGRGGMGVVYLAERADGQFEQQVALKLVKRGMDSAAILQRFLGERQILARLQHPNVARLLDGGVSTDGQPYFAMEYVEGEPITAYADARRLNVAARLRLFADACEAVRYAHQRLVVHRDLKPSNILVTEPAPAQAGEGTVKLLDFGIATLLGGEATPDLTATDRRLLTPEYAAPEQARGEPVTTATDVYALGVVLYELLTGRRPYRAARRDSGAFAEGTDTAEPAQPSSLVVRGASSEPGEGIPGRAAAADARATSPTRLRRRLAGDLDAIVLKALRTNPARRYASAEALLDDLRRHRAGLPVRARPDTPGYRAAAFVRRHRISVLAAVLVGLSLLGGLGAALWQGRRATHERDAARREAARADQVATFLTNLFYLADPNYALGDTLTMPAALDSAVAWLDRDLAAQPEARADLALKLSEIVGAMGDYDRERLLADSALAIRRRVFGDDSPEVAFTLTVLAEALRGHGQLAEAEPFLREALAINRRHLGRDHLNVAYTLNLLALALREQRRLDEAEGLLREALAINRVHAGDYAIGLHRSLTNLAHVLRAQGRPAEAEALHREVLPLRRAYWGDAHPEVANTLTNLGQVLGDQRRYDEAEPLLRDGLAMRRALQGDDHPEVGVDLGGLAALLHRKGDLAAAEATYRDALAHQQRALGAAHPTTTETARALARVWAEQAQALPLIE